MIWICKQGHQNWAYEFNCQDCGAPRTSGVKWFLPDPLVMATDKQEALKGKGPNWICTGCDSENPVYEETNCKNCGMPIGKAKTTSKIIYPSWNAIPRTAETAVSFQVHVVDHGNAGWNMGPDVAPKSDYIPAHKPAPHSQPRRQATERRENVYPATLTSQNWFKSFFNQELGSSGIKYSFVAWAILILSVISIIVYAIWFNYYDTTTKTAWVNSLEWHQNTKVEQHNELTKTDWDEDVPGDAYSSSCTLAVRDSNHQFSDGFKEVEYDAKCDEPVVCEPVGDGAGGVSVPTGCTKQVDCKKTRKEEQFHYGILWDNSCTYKVMRWELVNNFPSSGDTHDTYFDHGGYTSSDTIRITEETGTYTVHFGSEYTKPFSFNYDYEEWLKFDLREIVSAEVSKQGTVPYKPKIKELR